MGNVELKTAFKNKLKEETSCDLEVTFDLLDEQELVELVFHQVKDKMALPSDLDLQKIFKESNKQENEVNEALSRQRLLAEISE